MTSNDLFSHPEEPESASNPEHDSEPVEFPMFSDRPEKQSTARNR